MDFPTATFNTSRGLIYSFIHVPPNKDKTQRAKPYLLFLHGFPSLALDFYPQITHFAAQGYPILAPDLIGFGASSRPTDSSLFRQKDIAGDLVEILDHVRAQSVVVVAHDLGAQIATRLEFYHPDRVTRLAFLTVGPIAVGQPFDLDLVNGMTKDALGYEGFGYQEFLTRCPNAIEILADRHESFTDLMFTRDHDLWKDNFGARKGLQNWLTGDQRCSRISGFTEDLAVAHKHTFSREQGGYDGAQRWYVRFVNNRDMPDDVERLRELGVDRYTVSHQKPVLLLTARDDPIAIPHMQLQMTQQQYIGDPATNLTVEQVVGGHWIGLEDPPAVNRFLQDFLSKN